MLIKEISEVFFLIFNNFNENYEIKNNFRKIECYTHLFNLTFWKSTTLFLYLYFLIFIFVLPYTNIIGLFGVFTLYNIVLFLSSMSFLLGIYIFKNYNAVLYINLCSLYILPKNLGLHLEFKLDFLSISFISLTLTIGLISNLYTFSYFRGDANISRFLVLMHFFIISMVLFLLASNLVILFLGWELIGLSSFLLINFWNIKISSLKSSLKALYFNKWSDSFLFLFIIFSYNYFGTLDIDNILSNIYEINRCGEISLWSEHLIYQVYVNDIDYLELKNNSRYKLDFKDLPNTKNIIQPPLLFWDIYLPDVLFLFLLLASSIKSAQFIFHLWLPDSMEAPIPASALIHSATLVSSGIYLINRFSEFLIFTPNIQNLGVIWGSITAVYGGICASAQNDIKKLLAYSTISHCGNMYMLSFLGFTEITIIYLYIHGYFKALSFFSAGNIIRFYKNNQDIRKMGMSAYYLPTDSFGLCFSLFNLGGLPMSLGYYIKNYLFMFINLDNIINFFINVSIISTSLTGFIYFLRVIYNIFFDYKKGNKNIYLKLESRAILSSFMSSNSFIIMYLLLFSYFLSITVVIYLIAKNSPIVDGFKDSNLESQDYLKLSRQDYKFSISKFKNFNYGNSIIATLLLILILDYNYNSDRRFIITEKNGIIILYSFFFIIELYFIFSNIILYLI